MLSIQYDKQTPSSPQKWTPPKMGLKNVSDDHLWKKNISYENFSAQDFERIQVLRKENSSHNSWNI